MDKKNIDQSGWTEYGQLVLSKLDELNYHYKEIQNTLDVVNQRLAKLEAKDKDLRELESWRDSVTETWSPRQMKEVKDEVYKQKEKWTGAWFVFVTIQIIWGLLLAFKDKIF